MWDAWGIDEGLIYSVQAAQFLLTAYVGSYTIGSGAAFSTTRPSRIYGAYVVTAKTFSATTQTSITVLAGSTAGLAVGMAVTGTGIPTGATIVAISANTSITLSSAATASASVTLTAIGGNRNEIRIVDQAAYYAHNDLGATSGTPEELYPDFNVDASGFAKLYMWPIPNGVNTTYIELETAIAFVSWALATNYLIPSGYQDAIEWSVAMRCLPGFGEAVNERIVGVVNAEGQRAEARLRAANVLNRKIQPQEAMVPGSAQAPQKQGA